MTSRTGFEEEYSRVPAEDDLVKVHAGDGLKVTQRPVLIVSVDDVRDLETSGDGVRRGLVAESAIGALDVENAEFVTGVPFWDTCPDHLQELCEPRGGFFDESLCDEPCRVESDENVKSRASLLGLLWSGHEETCFLPFMRFCLVASVVLVLLFVWAAT